METLIIGMVWMAARVTNKYYLAVNCSIWCLIVTYRHVGNVNSYTCMLLNGLTVCDSLAL